jgi:hypothetical protein
MQILISSTAWSRIFLVCKDNDDGYRLHDNYVRFITQILSFKRL